MNYNNSISVPFKFVCNFLLSVYLETAIKPTYTHIIHICVKVNSFRLYIRQIFFNRTDAPHFHITSSMIAPNLSALNGGSVHRRRRR